MPSNHKKKKNSAARKGVKTDATCLNRSTITSFTSTATSASSSTPLSNTITIGTISFGLHESVEELAYENEQQEEEEYNQVQIPIVSLPPPTVVKQEEQRDNKCLSPSPSSCFTQAEEQEIHVREAKACREQEEEEGEEEDAEDMEIQVLSKESILKYVEKTCDSAMIAMKIIERYPNANDGRIDGKAWIEIQKIEGACRFLDGLLDGRTFISLPAECTLEGTRRLLGQIKLADGVRAIAIRLEENCDTDDSVALSSTPRLYLALTDKTTSTMADMEMNRSFERILDGLTVTRKLPSLPKPSIPTKDTPLLARCGNDEENADNEEIAFPSLFDAPSFSSISHKEGASLDKNRAEEDKQEHLKPEILPRRSHSVPEALSIPWVHQSIPAWRYTSMPSWTACTHHHQPNTPSLASITTASSSALDSELIMTPVLLESKLGSSCMHVRELSNSDTAVTVATSVHDNENEDGGAFERFKKENIRGLGIVDAEDTRYNDECALGDAGIIHGGEGEHQGKRMVSLASSAESDLTIRAFANHHNYHEHHDHRYSTMTRIPTRPNLPIRPPYKPYSLHPYAKTDSYHRKREYGPAAGRGGHRSRTDDRMPIPLREMHNGSRKSVIRGLGRRLPPLGIPFYKMDPPPCNRHYLLEEGCSSPNCPYAHDYILSSMEIDRLRLDSRKSPCSSLKMGKNCPVGKEKCHMGHVCPYGIECRYGVACRFLHIPGAHDGPPVNEHCAVQAIGQRGHLTITLVRGGIPPSPPISPPGTSDGSLPMVCSPTSFAPPQQKYDAPPHPLRVTIPVTPPVQSQPMALLSPPHLVFPPHPALSRHEDMFIHHPGGFAPQGFIPHMMHAMPTPLPLVKPMPHASISKTTPPPFRMEAPLRHAPLLGPAPTIVQAPDPRAQPQKRADLNAPKEPKVRAHSEEAEPQSEKGDSQSTNKQSKKGKKRKAFRQNKDKTEADSIDKVQ